MQEAFRLNRGVDPTTREKVEFSSKERKEIILREGGHDMRFLWPGYKKGTPMGQQ